jgi:hypothetical protein
LLDAIKAKWGSLDNFISAFNTTTAAVQVCLCVCLAFSAAAIVYLPCWFLRCSAVLPSAVLSCAAQTPAVLCCAVLSAGLWLGLVGLQQGQQGPGHCDMCQPGPTGSQGKQLAVTGYVMQFSIKLLM